MRIYQRARSSLLTILVGSMKVEDPARFIPETRLEFGGDHSGLPESGADQIGFPVALVERGVLVEEGVGSRPEILPLEG